MYPQLRVACARKTSELLSAVFALNVVARERLGEARKELAQTASRLQWTEQRLEAVQLLAAMGR